MTENELFDFCQAIRELRKRTKKIQKGTKHFKTDSEKLAYFAGIEIAISKLTQSLGIKQAITKEDREILIVNSLEDKFKGG